MYYLSMRKQGIVYLELIILEGLVGGRKVGEPGVLLLLPILLQLPPELLQNQSIGCLSHSFSSSTTGASLSAN
jgi:hypothetical protein